MPNTFTESVFKTTYKDDFLDSDNYHRILFNSGRALQARELTQLQTIIQEEVARFGRNIFKDGASVNPGGPTINNEYEFIKLDTSINSLPTDISTLVGTEFTGGQSDVKARVLEVVIAEGSDPATLYVQYTDTSSGTSGENPIRMSAGEDMSNQTVTLTVQSTDTVTNPATGRGTRISNDAGDFFVRGHFVFAKPQSLILSKYSRKVSKVVGFKVTEDIVTTADDTALFDNQGATPNLSSPGADRYRIQLTLTTQDQINSDENFVYYCDVVDGDIVDQVSGTEDYNKIAEVLAERTREESGNYIVDQFTVDFEDSGTNLIATVSDGIAYINGFRGASEIPTKLTIAKPRTTQTLENEVTGVSYGQYFICDSSRGAFNIAQFEQVALIDSAMTGTNFGGTATDNGGKIGTARVRYVEEDGSNQRVYLFDIKMDAGKAIRNTKAIYGGDSDRANILLENNKAVIKETNLTNLVYALPQSRPSNITDVDFEIQRLFTDTTNADDGEGTGTGGATLSVSNTGETLVNTSQWIVTVDSSGEVVSPSEFTGSGTTSVTIKGLPTSSAITVYAKVNKAAATRRTKTLNETTFSGAIESDGTGVKFIDLHAADIFDVISIKETDSDGRDLSALFTVDNGQKAGFYANGRLVLETGATAPTGAVFSRFKHFTHGAGDFFDVTSYTGQVNYEDIPAFQTGPRSSINLRDVIDFRSVVDSDGLFIGADAKVNEIPTNGDIWQGDVTYYLPRRDKIVLSTDGTVKNITGEAGFDAQFPETPDNTLGLFLLEHGAYGLNDSDVESTPIEAKRFTMSDINKLEERVDKLEEVTSLSLLEVDTSALLVLDSAGNPRSKSGFFVDNFSDRSFSDIESLEYRAAIDPSRNVLTVQTSDENISLVYDSDKSSNTILKGDNVYLKFTESVAISQTTISGAENVNPFAVVTGEGNITLSPASDEWIQTKYKPANVINKTVVNETTINEGRLRRGTAASRNRGFSWSNITFIPITGFGIEGLNLFNGWNGTNQWNNNGVRLTGSQTSGRTTTNTFEQRIVTSDRTVTKVTGDRRISLTFLPFMRSRKIMFRAEGLRPNTRYFPFFDGKDVSSYCREETFNRHASGTSLAYGNKFRKSAAHPQGSVDLESDANGKIEGSFFLPSRNDFRFRGGTREFKLLDISANNDENALSRAAANYTSQGTLDTRQKTITSTRIVHVRRRRWTEVTRRDPLAQSFLVTKPSGMFVTKVDVFFKSKDDSIPVEMQIRPVVNGQPSATDIITNAVKFLTPAEVSLPASQTQAAVVAAPTTFEFDEPIFLNPNTEYCIVLLAESKEYEVYVAETYAFELGSTEKRVNRQPSMGSLFKSQNGATWTPDQTKDLAFRIHQAEFSTAGGFAIFENADVPEELLTNNPFHMDSGDATVTLLFPNHGYSVGDKINIDSASVATDNINIVGTDTVKRAAIAGERTITAVDGFGLRYEADSSPTASGRFGGDEVITDRQLNFDVATPNFITIIPDDTTINYGVKYMTGSSLAGTETRFQKDASFSSEVQIGDENIFTSPKLIAKSTNETAELGAGERSVTFKVNLATSRADVSPVIDCQRTSLTTISNMIDNQAAAAASGFNVPLTYRAETNAFGGSALSKHITSVQFIEEDAVGLKVILAAIRPSGAEIDLYFRVANDGDDIFQTDWTLQASETTIAPDENNFREYRYLIGGDGGDINPFTQYQLKLVMNTNNQSKPPIIKDLRGIALAV